MCSDDVNSLFLAAGNIDAFFSLREPIASWRKNITRLINDDYQQPMPESTAFTLTQPEWNVLRELKKGSALSHIAEKEQLSYRRASALKNSAMKKLGLRNKNHLLVFLAS